MNSATTVASDTLSPLASLEPEPHYVQCRCGQLSLVRAGDAVLVCRDCGRWHGLRWTWEPSK